MGIKFEGTIKLDVTINIAITVSVAIFILLSNNQIKEDTQETKQDVKQIPADVKKLTRDDLVKIIERVNNQGNTSNSTALTTDQILQIAKQILREVR